MELLMWTDSGIFSATLLWIALVVKMTRRWLPKSVLAALAIAALIIGMVPFNDLVIGSYLFSLVSYLSVPSLLLLSAFILLSCLEQGRKLLRERWEDKAQWLPVYGFFAISGVLLYPLAGGLTLFDPYRLGFEDAPFPPLLPLYLLGWCLACVYWRWLHLLVLILGAIAAFYLKLLPSLNLWDYVIDPLIVFYSLFMLVKRGVCGMFPSCASNG
jgi:hypothetical protein